MNKDNDQLFFPCREAVELRQALLVELPGLNKQEIQIIEDKPDRITFEMLQGKYSGQDVLKKIYDIREKHSKYI